jgi:hypothetical protein
MTSSDVTTHDSRGKFRETAAAAAHPRPTASTLPLPSLRATTVSSSLELYSSIQSRPLQANPAAPFLWNGTSGTTQGSCTLQHRTGSTVSSNSTRRSSIRGSMERRLGGELRGSEDSDHRSGTTAHILQPHKPGGNHTSLPGEGGAPNTASSSGALMKKADRPKRVAAANYNALFQQEQREPSTISSPSPFPMPALREADQPGPTSTSALITATAAFPAEGASSAHGERTETRTPFATVTGGTYPINNDQDGVIPSLGSVGAMEGPLPPEVRRLIAQACPADPVSQETAEQQARRLLSTGRRVKVYREELAAAEEEQRDWSAAAEQRHLVRSVLQSEVDDINARIQALLQERSLCEAQLRAEDEAASREQRKLAEAQERVAVLRRTIDDIVEETVVPRLMLQQLVPSLLLENYV